MSSCEVFDSYINTIDVIEDSVIDDTKFPVVKDASSEASRGYTLDIKCQVFRDHKIKQIFRVMLEFLKVIINYLKYYINATKESKTRYE